MGTLVLLAQNAQADPEVPWWAAAVLALVALVVWFLALRQFRRGFRLVDIPVSATEGAFVGTVRFEGEPAAERALRTPFLGEPSVWYRAEVKRREQQTTTRRDPKTGRSSTSTRTTWRTVWRSSAEVPFHLRDDSGEIWVVPDGASVSGVRGNGDYRRIPDPDSAPRIGARGALGALLGTGSSRRGWYGRRGRDLRWSVHYLPVGTTTTIIGPVRWTQEGPLAFVARPAGAERMGLPEPASMGPDSGPFEILAGDHGTARRKNRWPTIGLTLAAMALTVGTGVVGALSADWSPVVGVILGGVAAVLIALISLVVGGINRAVRVANRAAAGAAEVDVQLQRRGDLLSSAAQAAAGHATVEASTLEAIAVARSASEDPEAAEAAEGAQRELRGRLLALGEQYPDLASSGSFVSLGETITDCENRLALARTYYNSAARALADLHGQVPWGLFARLGRVRPLPLLEFPELRYQEPPQLAEQLRARAEADAGADDPTADDEGRLIESEGEDEDAPEDEDLSDGQNSQS